MDSLSTTFTALADPTRRAILSRLAIGPANVAELARPFSISQPAISRHLKVLERAGLIKKRREAQSRPCSIDGTPIKDVVAWAEGYRQFWASSFDRLDSYLQDLQQGKELPVQIANESELVFTRVFDATQALVFAAWTEPDHLARWSGPHGFTTSHSTVDLREGGSYRACLRSPEGAEHWVRGVYRTIQPPHLLEMTHAWEDEHGEPGPQTLVTINLSEELPGKTRMHFRQSGFDSASSRDGHARGWAKSFDRLQAHLEGVAT